MARKKYKITAAVIASQSYADHGNKYKFKVGFKQQDDPLIICNTAECPLIECDENDVMGTDNDWAQTFLDQQIIPRGLFVNGVNYFGTPGVMALEETTDPETIDLDAIFPTT